jgi:hypothetical protein
MYTASASEMLVTAYKMVSKLNLNALLSAPLSNCFHAGMFLGLVSDTEDGGDIFFRNVC